MIVKIIQVREMPNLSHKQHWFDPQINSLSKTQSLHMSNIFFHCYRVQIVNNSLPDLGFEMGSIRDYVDLCSNISRPKEKGEVLELLYFHLSAWSSKGAIARKSRDSASPFCQIISFCISQSRGHQLGQWHSLELAPLPRFGASSSTALLYLKSHTCQI